MKYIKMDLRKYIYGHCVHPIKMNIYDAKTQQYVTRYVPCGKCLHCKNQKINEWTTRLYAQAMYSKNVYYITLDYAPFDKTNDVAMSLAVETAAAEHDINYWHTFGLHPLLLRKEHLQRFFKRLRKNTGKAFQYFACGEYGGSYKGHGFGRPHFHCIIFSDDTFSDADFAEAWTLNGYKIGNVDFNDLRANGSFIENKSVNDRKSANYVFKYVCKYLQKNDFKFENLATIEYHKAYFNSLQKVLIEHDKQTLFPSSEYVPITDQKVLADNWKAYTATYSPFCVCSKRPAIGLRYFEENVERFKTTDFRLFGLSHQCSAFPRYFLRKTKESLCSFSAFGRISENPTGASRIGNIITLLNEIRDTNRSIENWTACSPTIWCDRGDGLRTDLVREGEIIGSIENLLYSFYDNKNKLFYYFNGYNFNVKQKIRKIGIVDVGTLSIDDAITMISNDWLDLYNKYIIPTDHMRELNEISLAFYKKQLFADIDDPYGDEKFNKLIYDTYNRELLSWNMKGKIINNTKQSF